MNINKLADDHGVDHKKSKRFTAISRVLLYYAGVYQKQCGPRSDCSTMEQSEVCPLCYFSGSNMSSVEKAQPTFSVFSESVNGRLKLFFGRPNTASEKYSVIVKIFVSSLFIESIFI